MPGKLLIEQYNYVAVSLLDNDFESQPQSICAIWYFENKITDSSLLFNDAGEKLVNQEIEPKKLHFKTS